MGSGPAPLKLGAGGYNEPETLAVELGASFRLLESEREKHVTSGGKVQSFQFCRFERRV